MAKTIIILPNSFTHSLIHYKEVRKKVLENFRIEEIVFLPTKIFLPFANVYTIILYLTTEKPKKEVYCFSYQNNFLDFWQFRKTRENFPRIEISQMKEKHYFIIPSLYQNYSWEQNNKVKRLKEIATFQRGYWKQGMTLKEKGEFIFIKVGDLGKNGKIERINNCYFDLVPELAKDYVLEKGDLVVARVGATAGKTVLFSGKDKVIASSCNIRVKLNSEIILPEYFICFTQSQEYWEQVKKFVYGTTQLQLNIIFLKEIKVLLPSLEEQKKITKH